MVIVLVVYYGELTRIHKLNLPHLKPNLKFSIWWSLLAKNCGHAKATNNYLPSRKAGESYYFIAFPRNSLNIVYDRCNIPAVITVPTYNMAGSVNCCYYATFTPL